MISGSDGDNDPIFTREGGVFTFRTGRCKYFSSDEEDDESSSSVFMDGRAAGGGRGGSLSESVGMVGVLIPSKSNIEGFVLSFSNANGDCGNERGLWSTGLTVV